MVILDRKQMLSYSLASNLVKLKLKFTCLLSQVHVCFTRRLQTDQYRYQLELAMGASGKNDNQNSKLTSLRMDLVSKNQDVI